MKKLNVGVIGLGEVAHIGHLPWYLLNPQSHIEAMADIDKSRLNYASEKYHVSKSYIDYRKILEDKSIDAVSICTPVHTHKDIVVEAAEHGKHILVEKPMGIDVDECNQMIRAAERNGVILMVGFMKRFNPSFQAIKDILDRKEIGVPHYLDVHWSLLDIYQSKGFRYRLFTGGGIFQDHGSHYIDLFRWWTNDEISTVSAELNIIVDGREVEDHASVLLRFNGGAIGTIETSRAGMEHPNYRLFERGQIYTTHGAISFMAPDWTSFELPIIEKFDGEKWIRIKSFKESKETVMHYMFKREIDHFIDSIIREKTPLVTGYDGLKAIEVINAAYLSFFEKRKIYLPLEKNFKLDKELFLKIPRFNK